MEPANREALTGLANQYVLLGTAYTGKRDEKRDLFRKAAHYGELAMYANPGFRKAVDSGKKPWQAADQLGRDDVEAMLFWAFAVHYEFREPMRLPAKIMNVKWLENGEVIPKQQHLAKDATGT